MNFKNWKEFTISTSSDSTYKIPDFKLQNDPFIFTYVSYFLSFITPHDLPFDVLRKAIFSNITFGELLMEALQVEAGLISLMTIILILAFIPLGVTISWCCHRKPKEIPEEPDPLMILDEENERPLQCKKHASIVTLVIIFFLIILNDVAIYLTNNQAMSAVDLAPDLIQASVHDIEIFLKDSHTQIKKSLDNGFDSAIKNITQDLEDVDELLGEPIRSEISSSTGIELAFDSLQGINSANIELVNRILQLQESISKSLKISQEAATRMEELQIQLSVLQRQCTFRDRPLCDTLRIRSFEENGIIDALKSLQEDQSIFKMRYLGELEIGTAVKNLSTELAISKSIFGNFPAQVKSDTLLQRNEMIEQLDLIKSTTTTMAQTLTHALISIVDQLSGTWESIESYYTTFNSYSGSYWGFTWLTASFIFMIILFMMITICCGLCKSKIKASIMLVITVIIICGGSFLSMIFAIFTLALGGNGEIFLCQPLFYDDKYFMIGKMFDKPGLFYKKEPEAGIIGELLRPSGYNKSVINVTLATALRECKENKSSYNVFQLGIFLNTTKMVDLKQYPKLDTAISSIEISERTLLSLTQTLQNILENMLQTSELNLLNYRSAISQPNPEKDLATFIDQMQRVALQIQDVATSSRMNTLGSRAKRLQGSILQPLEQLRNEILYHLTALELQKDPWAKQVNQTFHHLKNIQNFLDKTAAEICANQTTSYIKRLRNYLTSNKDKVSLTLGDHTAPCRPLFDIFDANRILLCRYGMDSLNGLWFCAFLCLLLWCIGTPIGLHIITINDEIKFVKKFKESSSRLYGTPPDTMLISEQSNWGAPSNNRSTDITRSNWQNSIRSVRWETSEMDFEDVDSPNTRHNLI